MRGKLFNIKNLLLAIFIVGSIFYAPHANGQAAAMTANNSPVCAGTASPVIKFTYTGTGNEGTAPYTFTYKINNGSDLTVTTVTNDTVSIFVPTNIAGDYTYSLIKVRGSLVETDLIRSEIKFTINAAPTVPEVRGTTNLCVGGTSRLSSDSLGGTWSTSDESIATVEPDGDVIAHAAGQVAIYYTITNSDGCSSTAITTVTVYPIPTIEQITGTSDVCIGSTTTFTTATTGGTWTWTSSTTNVATINSSGVITGVSAGTATITYNFTNSQTSCSASATKIVTVLAVPTVADIGGTFSLCKNTTTTLTNSTAGGVWSSNLTNIATVGSITGVVTGVSSGTATISYSVTGLNGCTTSVTQAVVVSAPTVNPISLTATSLCVGGTITATSATAGGTWTIENTNIATINSSGVITGVAAGTSSVVYTVSSGGCSNSTAIGITVLEQPVPTFTFTNNPCSGASVGFTSSVTGTGPYTYSWNFGDGSATSNLQNPSHVFTSLGCGTATFDVTLTITDASGCSNSVVNTITVKQQADIDFRDTRNPTRQFNNCGLPVSSSSYTITLDRKSTSAVCVSSYTIDWGDGSTPETVSLPYSHTYTRAGTFSLIVTATADNGCTSSKIITVKNIGNPSGGIVNPGNTSNLCAPTSNVDLAISNWGTNALGTQYRVDYGDGSIVTYTQEQMIASNQYNAGSPASSTNFPIPHSYNISSCPSGSLTVSLTIFNSCGSTSGTTTIGPITCSTKSGSVCYFP